MGWMQYLWMETLAGVNPVSDYTELVIDKLREIVYVNNSSESQIDIPTRWIGWYNRRG